MTVFNMQVLRGRPGRRALLCRPSALRYRGLCAHSARRRHMRLHWHRPPVGPSRQVRVRVRVRVRIRVTLTVTPILTPTLNPNPNSNPNPSRQLRAPEGCRRRRGDLRRLRHLSQGGHAGTCTCAVHDMHRHM